MGKLHNELRRGPWSAAISSALGDTREGGVERFGETLTPVVNIWERPDWAVLIRHHLLYLSGFQAAVAGEFSCIVFQPPPTTNAESILVIDRLLISGTIQCLVGYDALPAGAVELTLKDFLDQRARPAPAQRPLSRVFQDSNAASALTGPFLRFTGGVAGSNVLEGPFILSSVQGLSLVVECGTVNTSITVTAFGRERQLMPSERIM